MRCLVDLEHNLYTVTNSQHSKLIRGELDEDYASYIYVSWASLE